MSGPTSLRIVDRSCDPSTRCRQQLAPGETHRVTKTSGTAARDQTSRCRGFHRLPGTVRRQPIHPEHVIEVLSVITVGMNYRRASRAPRPIVRQRRGCRSRVKHFSDGTVRRVLAGLNDAGDRGPRLVVGAFDQKHLPIANDHSGHTRQPQRRMSDVPTKLDDEFGDRHHQSLKTFVRAGSPGRADSARPDLDVDRRCSTTGLPKHRRPGLAGPANDEHPSTPRPALRSGSSRCP